jgi:hypothetical protein
VSEVDGGERGCTAAPVSFIGTRIGSASCWRHPERASGVTTLIGDHRPAARRACEPDYVGTAGPV